MKYLVIGTIALSACLLLASENQLGGFALASSEFRKGHYAQACDLLNQLVATDPASAPEIYRLLSESWMHLNEPAKAADALQWGMREHPDSVVLLKAMGQLLFSLNPEDPRVGQWLGKAELASPEDPEIHHYLAEWTCITDQNALCIAEGKKVLATPGLNDMAMFQMYTLMAMAKDQMGDAEQAEMYFRKAMTINRRLKQFDADAAVQFATYLGHLGRQGEERTILNEVVRRAPTYGPAHLELARLLRRDDKFEQAASEAELALRLNGCQPNDVHAAHVLLASLYWALGNKTAAAEHRQLADSH